MSHPEGGREGVREEREQEEGGRERGKQERSEGGREARGKGELGIFPGASQDNPDLSAVVHTSLQTNGYDCVMPYTVSVECPFLGNHTVCVHVCTHCTHVHIYVH